MKKLWIFLILGLFSLNLLACDTKHNTANETKVLEDTTSTYYVTSQESEWQINDNNKLSAISLSESHAKALLTDKNNILYLYFGGNLNLANDADWDFAATTVNGKSENRTLNGGRAFKITKITGENKTNIPDGIDNVSAISDNVTIASNDIYHGLFANEASNYILIFAQFKKEVNGKLYGVGLIKTDSTTPINPDEPTPTETLPASPSDSSNIYDGDDILPTDNDANLANTVQDGLILHAWNWSYKTIEENLDDIYNAGYTTIQVSPVQQPKDYSENYGKGWNEQWWKLYQPLSFSIAKSSWLGTKDDLISLCTAAHKKGIFIIADIVSNHVANLNSDSQTGKETVYKDLATYEPELYANRNSYIRSYITNNDNSIEAVVRGNIGEPDLKTETKFVQDMVIDLLKECIDCGIDGFRFDAAKHIETPDDGAYASDYWPNVLNASTTYAQSKGKTMYYYGEILNSPGANRKWSSYTKYMSITDNRTGNNIRTAIVNGNASSAANASYATGEAANKLVLWAESHDTYANDDHESTNVSEENINKTWAMVASRKDATALYFARPNLMGSIGSYAFKSNEVTSVNLFHNTFIGANEYVGSSSNFSYVTRYTDTTSGVVIVNCKGTSASVNMKVNNMLDGTYQDDITGNTFVVKDGNISGNIGSTGIAVIYNSNRSYAPNITVSQENGFFSNTLTLQINLSHATSARILINGKSQIIEKSTTIELNDIENGSTVNVKITAINNDYRITKEYSYTRIDGLSSNSIVVKDLKATFISGEKYDIYAWVFPTGGTGHWVKTKIINDYVVFEYEQNDENFLLVLFSKGRTPEWNYKIKQTPDFAIVKNKIYSAPFEIWE